MKQIALAMYNYHETYGSFPPAAIKGKDGQSLYSWRVLMLPYLEEGKLYNRFHRDEPWDSPHNKPLLEEMPKIYRPLMEPAPPSDSVDTYIQVFVGPGTPFEGDGLTLEKIRKADGESNTILLIEAGEPVPWTKPADILYDPDQPLPPVGGIFQGHGGRFGFDKTDGFNVVVVDGSVRFLDRKMDPELLRAMITWKGGEEIQVPDVLPERFPALPNLHVPRFALAVG